MDDNKRKVKCRVEYESTPIRHMSIQCPECKKWFWAYDIAKERPYYSYQISNTQCKCPICSYGFNIAGCYDIEEMGYSDIKKDVLEKNVSVTWS